MLSDPKKRAFTIASGSIPKTLQTPRRVALVHRRGRTAPSFDFTGLTGAPARLRRAAAAAVFATSLPICLAAARERKRTTTAAAQRGADIEMPLSLSFEEAIKGLTTNITVNRSEQCSRCNGAGDIGGPVIVCSTCKGSGQVQRAGGRLRFAQECPDCGGTGRRRSPCSLCQGKG